MKNIMCFHAFVAQNCIVYLIFFIASGVAKNMIACIATAVQEPPDNTFIIHKHK
jgi:hypothetical protein